MKYTVSIQVAIPTMIVPRFCLQILTIIKGMVLTENDQIILSGH